MTRDEIIRMAREAGDDVEHTLPSDLDFLERFTAFVAAAERADCAAVCKDEAKRLADYADRLEARGSNYEARQIRGLAWKCNALKERIEDRGKQ